MCELLGISANHPLKKISLFKEFKKRGIINPDGWGIGFYKKRSFSLFKEEKNILESNAFEKFIIKMPPARLIIAHVRKSSVGDNTIENTHPFKKILNGKTFVFAHNGTLKSLEHFFPLKRFFPTGKTDSEYAFCYLLERLHEISLSNWKEEHFNFLAKIISQINKKGSFNMLLSEGRYLFSYFDKTGFNGLCYNLKTEEKTKKISIIASKRLTSEKWRSFKFGELIVFQKGEPIFSNKRSIKDIIKSSEFIYEKQILEFLNSFKKREIKIKDILEHLKLPKKITLESLHSLLCKGEIEQIDWTKRKWNNINSHYKIVKNDG